MQYKKKRKNQYSELYILCIDHRQSKFLYIYFRDLFEYLRPRVIYIIMQHSILTFPLYLYLLENYCKIVYQKILYLTV